jgi:hypothetical protein
LTRHRSVPLMRWAFPGCEGRRRPRPR